MSHIRISLGFDTTDGKAKILLNGRNSILASDFCYAAMVPSSPVNRERVLSFLSERLGFPVNFYFYSAFSVDEKSLCVFSTYSKSELNAQLQYLSSLISECLMNLAEFHNKNDDKIDADFCDNVLDVSPGFIIRHNIKDSEPITSPCL